MGSRGAPTSGAVKVLASRRAGVCGSGVRLPVGTRAGWDRQRRAVVCLDCLGEGLRFGVSGSSEAATVGVVATPEPSVTDGDAAEEPPTPASPMEPSPTVVDVGSSGSSLQAEYERRAADREGRARARPPPSVASCWLSQKNRRQQRPSRRARPVNDGWRPASQSSPDPECSSCTTGYLARAAEMATWTTSR